MEKFLEKSISHVQKLFPSIYSTRTKKGSFHFSIALERSKIIAVGVNKPDQINAKALQFAQKLGLPDKILYPYVHSEEDLVGRLIGLDRLSSSLKIVVLRMNKFGMLGESRPCSSCAEILSAYGLNRIYWSTANGEICS